jgi:carbon dioxide concentrating mechanism protein CcmL
MGQAVSTIKDERLSGHTMLIVGRVGDDPNVVLDRFVALDGVGAGVGEIVGVIQGTPAQKAFDGEGLPIDAVIVAIFDSLNIEGKQIYKK